MFEVRIILLLAIVLIGFGLLEAFAHRRRLSKIPVRIHVNGTRGKSSVTRLIAGGLRESGMVTCAKTTGTLARMIFPDGSEYPVFRPFGANVIEQIRIVGAAAEHKAEALVIECMALDPHLQWLSESTFVKATCGVITNIRPDHLEVMGPEERDVALALASTVPVNAKAFTCETRYLPYLEHAAQDRGSEMVCISGKDLQEITDEEMSRFSYVEHKENVALALRVCRELGVDRETALRGMWNAPPDPGAMAAYHLKFFGRDIFFVNGFSANDPVSTRHIWEMALKRFPHADSRIAIFNCRADRPERSRQLGEACVGWPPADHYLLMGSGGYLFARAAFSKGMPMEKILFAENRSDSDIFERILNLTRKSSLVMGMGNTKGDGLRFSAYFQNRAVRITF